MELCYLLYHQHACVSVVLLEEPTWLVTIGEYHYFVGIIAALLTHAATCLTCHIAVNLTKILILVVLVRVRSIFSIIDFHHPFYATVDLRCLVVRSLDDQQTGTRQILDACPTEGKALWKRAYLEPPSGYLTRRL